MSQDLGLHNQSLNFFQTTQSRMQSMHKLRKLYSSSEAHNKKTFNSSFMGIEGTRSTAASGTGKASAHPVSPSPFEDKENSKQEVK